MKVERKKGPKLVQRVIGNKVLSFPKNKRTFEIDESELPVVEEFMEVKEEVEKEVTNGTNG